MRRIVMAAVLAMGCGGGDLVNHSGAAMYDTATDGSLRCGTWAAPGSITPACDSATSCVCDFACVENPSGGKAALRATFALEGQRWQPTASEYGGGC